MALCSPYLIGVHKAEDFGTPNSDSVYVVFNRWRHKNCSPFRRPAASDASWILDAIIDGPIIPPRSQRALLHAMTAQFVGVIDDRFSVRVGARCRAAADSYSKS
jgi:hypothetical protein